jgi:SAM-dependent methyltransferase
MNREATAEKLVQWGEPSAVKRDLYAEFQAELTKKFRDYGYSWDEFKEAACEWIIPHVPPGRGVDVGGTTYLVKRVNEQPNREMVFFDFFPPRDPEIKEFVVGDMAEFGQFFEPRSLDFITSRHTLEHSLNPLFVLWQLNQALKDNGRLIVVVPNHSEGWVWFYSHFNCLPRENWLMLFYRAGFKTVESTCGTWQPHNPDFIEHRFVLKVESRELRLDNNEYRDFRIGPR